MRILSKERETRAKQRFNSHIARAKVRKIPFHLSFKEWYTWFIYFGVDKSLLPEKFAAASLCMCRFGDTGPYSLYNIYPDTNSNNVRLQHKVYKTKKSYITPLGIYKSVHQAAEAHNCCTETIYKKIRTQVPGFSKE